MVVRKEVVVTHSIEKNGILILFLILILIRLKKRMKDCNGLFK